MNLITKIPVNYDILALINLCVNLGIMAVSVCRLGRMSNVLMRVKAQYLVLTVVACANGFAPVMFQQYPPLMPVVFAVTILGIMLADSYQWKDGAPAGATSDFVPLGDK